MNDDDKFFFDLKGFVHLKGVLSQEEVDRCNAAIDAHADRFFQTERTLEGDSKVLGGANKQKWMEGMLEWERPHCEPFRDLLIHAKIQPYLNELLGGGYRLDHGPCSLPWTKATAATTSTAAALSAKISRRPTPSNTDRCSAA